MQAELRDAVCIACEDELEGNDTQVQSVLHVEEQNFRERRGARTGRRVVRCRRPCFLRMMAC